MGEIKPLADAVKDVRAHERLHGGRGFGFCEVGRPLQQSKFKVASVTTPITLHHSSPCPAALNGLSGEPPSSLMELLFLRNTKA